MTSNNVVMKLFFEVSESDKTNCYKCAISFHSIIVDKSDKMQNCADILTCSGFQNRIEPSSITITTSLSIINIKHIECILRECSPLYTFVFENSFLKIDSALDSRSWSIVGGLHRFYGIKLPQSLTLHCLGMFFFSKK